MHLTDDQVAQAVDFVESMGVVDELSALIVSPRGRPRLLTVQGLLVGLVLSSWLNGGAVCLDRCADLLGYAIPVRWRNRFGIPARSDDARGFEAGYAVVRRLFHAVLAAADPSPLPKNRRLTKAQAQNLTSHADPEAQTVARQRLVRVSNRIIEASLAPLAERLSRFWDGSVAIDGTAIATFARGVSATGPHTSTDPDAAWYVREGDHRDTTKNAKTKKTKGGPRTRYLFGYEATLAVARNPDHQSQPGPAGAADPCVPPVVILGMVVDKPGHRPGPNAVDVLTDIGQRGHRPGFVAVDRAYNNSKPADFQLPARALGYQPVFDYPGTRLGIQGSAYGALLVDGGWHCPHTPRPLITATRDALGHGEEEIDQDTWRRRISAREALRLVPKGRPDSEGHQRFMCPAAAGRAQCPLKPGTLGRDPRLPLVDPGTSPVEPPRVCVQDSITIAPEQAAKDYQPLAHGSARWAQVYFNLRNSVEGINGFAKDPAVAALEQSRTRRVRGIAAQTLLVAFQLAYTNRVKIVRWLEQLPGENGAPRRRARRRKTRPLGSWAPRASADPRR
jgi:hypothetical protein